MNDWIKIALRWLGILAALGLIAVIVTAVWFVWSFSKLGL